MHVVHLRRALPGASPFFTSLLLLSSLMAGCGGSVHLCSLATSGLDQDRPGAIRTNTFPRRTTSPPPRTRCRRNASTCRERQQIEPKATQTQLRTAELGELATTRLPRLNNPVACYVVLPCASTTKRTVQGLRQRGKVPKILRKRGAPGSKGRRKSNLVSSSRA